MLALVVSDDMELVLPRAVTEELRLKPGQRWRAVDADGHIRLVPEMTLDDAYGILAPLNEPFVREADREL